MKKIIEKLKRTALLVGLAAPLMVPLDSDGAVGGTVGVSPNSTVTSFGSLTDVAAVSPSTGEAWGWDGVNWTNISVSAATGYMGEAYYVSNQVTTTLSATNWTAVTNALTYSGPASMGWTASSNAFVFNASGKTNVDHHVACTISYTNMSASAKNILFKLYKRRAGVDTPLTPGMVRDTTSDTDTTAIHVYASMTEGDGLVLYAYNTATSDIRMIDFNIFAMSMGAAGAAGGSIGSFGFNSNQFGTNSTSVSISDSAYLTNLVGWITSRFEYVVITNNLNIPGVSTASAVALFDSGKNLVSSGTISQTELNYLDGVTNGINNSFLTLSNKLSVAGGTGGVSVVTTVTTNGTVVWTISDDDAGSGSQPASTVLTNLSGTRALTNITYVGTTNLAETFSFISNIVNDQLVIYPLVEGTNVHVELTGTGLVVNAAAGAASAAGANGDFQWNNSGSFAGNGGLYNLNNDIIVSNSHDLIVYGSPLTDTLAIDGANIIHSGDVFGLGTTGNGDLILDSSDLLNPTIRTSIDNVTDLGSAGIRFRTNWSDVIRSTEIRNASDVIIGGDLYVDNIIVTNSITGNGTNSVLTTNYTDLFTGTIRAGNSFTTNKHQIAGSLQLDARATTKIFTTNAADGGVIVATDGSYQMMTLGVNTNVTWNFNNVTNEIVYLDVFGAAAADYTFSTMGGTITVASNSVVTVSAQLPKVSGATNISWPVFDLATLGNAVGQNVAATNAPTINTPTFLTSYLMTGSGSPYMEKVASTNNVGITNILGVNHMAYAATLVIDGNAHANKINVTNRVTGDLTLRFTNTVEGQEYSINVLGEASGGTSRTVTIIPHVAANANWVADLDAYGSAIAANKTLTLTNGNALEVSSLIANMLGTNINKVVTRQYSF